MVMNRKQSALCGAEKLGDGGDVSHSTTPGNLTDSGVSAAPATSPCSDLPVVPVGSSASAHQDSGNDGKSLEYGELGVNVLMGRQEEAAWGLLADLSIFDILFCK